MDIWLLWCSKSWCTLLKAQKDYWTFVSHLDKLCISLHCCVIWHTCRTIGQELFSFYLVGPSSSLKVTKDRKAFSSTLCCKKYNIWLPILIFRNRHKINIPNNSRYNFRLLDTHGWNFRHAHFHEEGRRTLYKVKTFMDRKNEIEKRWRRNIMKKQIWKWKTLLGIWH